MSERQRVTGLAKGLTGKDYRLIAICAALTVAAAVLSLAGANEVAAFVVAGLALAALASLVGRSVEALGDQLGAGMIGFVQSALGNLPELFVILFSLHSTSTTWCVPRSSARSWPTCCSCSARRSSPAASSTARRSSAPRRPGGSVC